MSDARILSLSSGREFRRADPLAHSFRGSFGGVPPQERSAQATPPAARDEPRRRPRDDGARVPPAPRRRAPVDARAESVSVSRRHGRTPAPLSQETSRRRAPARASVHVLAALDALQRERDHHAHLDLLVGVPLAPRHQQRVEVRREVAVEHLALAHGSCVLCGSCGAARRGATKCGGGLTSFGRVVEVARAFGWAMRRWCGAPRRRRRRSCSVKPTRLSLVNFGWGSSGRDRRRRAPRRYGAPAVELLYSRGITIP